MTNVVIFYGFIVLTLCFKDAGTDMVRKRASQAWGNNNNFNVSIICSLFVAKIHRVLQSIASVLAACLILIQGF